MGRSEPRARSGFVAVNGASLYDEVRGPRRAASERLPVLLVHGLSLDGHLLGDLGPGRLGRPVLGPQVKGALLDGGRHLVEGPAQGADLVSAAQPGARREVTGRHAPGRLAQVGQRPGQPAREVHAPGDRHNAAQRTQGGTCQVQPVAGADEPLKRAVGRALLLGGEVTRAIGQGLDIVPGGVQAGVGRRGLGQLADLNGGDYLAKGIDEEEA